MPNVIVVTSLSGKHSRDSLLDLARRAAEPMLHGRPRSWTPLVESDGLCIGKAEPDAKHLKNVEILSRDGITVIMEGYLSRLPEEIRRGPVDIQTVAEAYLSRGNAGVEALDGAFQIVVVDSRSRTIHLWTDRASVVPCYMTRLGDVLVVAPEAKCFARLPGMNREVALGSLAAMTMNGALLDDHTYWQDLRYVGPGCRITVSGSAVDAGRYSLFRMLDDPDRPPPPAPIVAEVLCRAVQRHVARFGQPILALSGGLDSRAILAAARRVGLMIPTITWGADRLDMPGSDFQTGREAARLAGVPHRTHVKDMDQFPANAERAVFLTDGLSGHIANHPNADILARELASEHDALIVGNEMFGWIGPTETPAILMARLESINTGRPLNLLRLLLRRDVHDAVRADYDRQLEGLLKPFVSSMPLRDVADAVAMYTWYGRQILSQAKIYHDHIHYVSPLMDGELVSLAATCRADLRKDKVHFVRCIAEEFPEQFALAFNRKHSRVNWRERLARLGPMQRYLVETLLEPLASFDEYFDRTSIRTWLADVTAEGKRVPWPEPCSVWQRLGLRMRALSMRHLFRHRVIMNLVTLKLWFKLFGS